MWSFRINTAGRNFISDFWSLIRTVAVWEVLSPVIGAVVALRAQQYGGLEYCAAALTAGLSLRGPLPGLIVSIVTTLGLVSGVEPVHVLVTWSVFIAVTFGKMSKSTYPVIAAGWTVLCFGIIIPLLVTMDITRINVVFKEVLKPSVIAAALTWSLFSTVQAITVQRRLELQSLVAITISATIGLISLNITGNLLFLTTVTVISILSPFTEPDGYKSVVLAVVIAVPASVIGAVSIAHTQLLSLTGIAIATGLNKGPGTIIFGITGVHLLAGLTGGLDPVLLGASATIASMAVLCGYGLRSRCKLENRPRSENSAIMNCLADSVETLRGQIDTWPWDEEAGKLIGVIRSTVCRGCSVKRQCWYHDVDETTSTIARFLEQNGCIAEDITADFCQRESYLQMAILMARAVRLMIDDVDNKLRTAQATILEHMSTVLPLLEQQYDRARTISWQTRTAKRGGRRVSDIFVAEGTVRAAIAVTTMTSKQRAAVLRRLQRLLAGGVGGKTIQAVLTSGPAGNSKVQCDVVTVDMHTGAVEIIQVGLTLIIISRGHRLEVLMASAGKQAVTTRLLSGGDALFVISPAPDNMIESVVDCVTRWHQDDRIAERLIEAAAVNPKQQVACLVARFKQCL